MAYEDMREFIALLEKKNLLKRVKTEVDPVLEIAEINDRIVKKEGPAVLFENCKGAKLPCVVNLFGSYERMQLALEVDDLNDIGGQMLEFLEPEIPTNLMQKLKALPKLKRLSDFLPKYVKSDGGRFITLPMVFTKDPETGERNCGMYRMQIFDSNTTGMHWHMHKDGARHYTRRRPRSLRA